MINHKVQCVFVQVPKTASTSIRSIVGIPQKPHLNIIQLEEQFDSESVNLDRTFSSYFKFGFVRNPWDRVVSLYRRKEGVQKSQAMSFEQFVRWIENSSDTCIHPSKHKYQLDWFKDSDGEIAANYIGKFESLNKDWAYISSVLGVTNILPHKNSNSSCRKHYSEFYTPETRDIIGEKFIVDVNYFKYSFSEN